MGGKPAMKDHMSQKTTVLSQQAQKAEPMLAHHLRRCPNIKPELVQH